MIVSIVLFSLTGWGGFWQRFILRIVLMPIVAGITYELIKWLGRTESKLGKNYCISRFKITRAYY